MARCFADGQWTVWIERNRWQKMCVMELPVTGRYSDLLLIKDVHDAPALSRYMSALKADINN